MECLGCDSGKDSMLGIHALSDTYVPRIFFLVPFLFFGVTTGEKTFESSFFHDDRLRIAIYKSGVFLCN